MSEYDSTKDVSSDVSEDPSSRGPVLCLGVTPSLDRSESVDSLTDILNSLDSEIVYSTASERSYSGSDRSKDSSNISTYATPNSEYGKELSESRTVDGEIVQCDNLFSDNLTSDILTSENLTSDNLTSDHLTSDNLTSDHLTSDNLTSDHLTSDNLTSENLTSDNLASDNLTSNNLTSENLSSDNVTSDNPTSENLSSDNPTTNIPISNNALSDNTISETIFSDTTISDNSNSDSKDINKTIEDTNTIVIKEINTTNINTNEEALSTTIVEAKNMGMQPSELENLQFDKEPNNNDPFEDSSPIESVQLEGATEDESNDYDSLLRSQSSQSKSNVVSEDDVISLFLDQSNPDAEARLLARRQARAEAREIRMRELERQQKEQEENADRQFDMLAEPLARGPRTTGNRYLSSRRSSEDSLEDGGSLRDMRHELKEVEEKFRKAMIANAQLDNDKSAQTYQLELLKDRLEELEEDHSQLKREHRDKCRAHDQLKRLSDKLQEDLAMTRAELDERDRLIAEKGLVIVGEEVPEEDHDGDLSNCVGAPRKALVSVENAQLLENAGEGSLDVRLGRFAKEKVELQDQISHLKLELEEERSKRRKSNSSGVVLNGPHSDLDYDAADIQREVSKQLAEYKFRAQKAEQDVATLQATVARLESQVIRYKSAAEVSEKSEEALKAERRKLQREAREATNRAEELETSNKHLVKRLDKLKNAKSALLKEL